MVAAAIDSTDKQQRMHDTRDQDDDDGSWVKKTPKKSPAGEKKQQQSKNHQKQQPTRGSGARSTAKKNVSSQPNSFGKRAWVKPSTTNTSSASSSSSSSSPSLSGVPAKASPATQEQEQPQQQQAPPNSIEEASERIEALVSQEMKDSQNLDRDDALTAMIGITAAVSLVAGLNEFGIVDVPPIVYDDDKSNSVALASFSAAKAEESTMSFQERCLQQSVHTLMEDYGEFDTSWKEQPSPSPPHPTTLVEVDSAVLETAATTDTAVIVDNGSNTQTIKNYGTSCLGSHGKAPIHVELTSFGYKYGAPGASKRQQGWSHAQPLAPFDCRAILPSVPSYLAWKDGLNGQVKRFFLSSSDKNGKNNSDVIEYDKDDDEDSQEQSISSYTQGIANAISNALLEAINDGGYGYAMPLKMVIYVGSELGRHRSVVACELAATALRKLLRANYDERFQQPCSVGTRHLHLDKKQSDSNSAAARSKKKNSSSPDDDVAYENSKLGKM